MQTKHATINSVPFSKVGELSIATGEILTVTNQDIGEGWYQGSNSRGEVGLFPAGYVQEITETQTSRPTSGTFQSPTSQFNNQQQFAAQQGVFATPQTNNYNAPNADQAAGTTEYYGDNWSDDEWSVWLLYF